VTLQQGFWDTSAVVPLIFREIHTPRAQATYDQAESFFAWDWLQVEVEAALARRQAQTKNWQAWEQIRPLFQWIHIPRVGGNPKTEPQLAPPCRRCCPPLRLHPPSIHSPISPTRDLRPGATRPRSAETLDVSFLVTNQGPTPQGNSTSTTVLSSTPCKMTDS
jgi:hypothetical protein